MKSYSPICGDSGGEGLEVGGVLGVYFLKVCPAQRCWETSSHSRPTPGLISNYLGYFPGLETALMREQKSAVMGFWLHVWGEVPAVGSEATLPLDSLGCGVVM